MVHSPLPSPPAELVITGENSGENSDNSVKNMLHNILSYNDNVMLAAVISLLLVILFVLLLHVYARWFLTHRSGTASVAAVPRRRRFRHTFHVDSTFPDSPEKASSGLDKSAISSIPLFVYNKKRGNNNHNNSNSRCNDEEEEEMECSICLSCFEDDDVGRKLPICSHAFHAECIEMWLFSHSSCPVCRSPVVTTTSFEVVVDLAPKPETEVSSSSSSAAAG